VPYRTQTPQYKLYEDAFSKLNRLARRYIGYTTPTPRDGVTQEKLDLLHDTLPVKLLSDHWDWENGETVTVALMRGGTELIADLRAMARVVRVCLEAEVFPDNRAGCEARDWLLSDLATAERYVEQFVNAVGLLSPTHLMLEAHYISAMIELYHLEKFDLKDIHGSDPVAVFALAVDRLYIPLQTAWETYFVTGAGEALEQYTAIAEKLHANASPLMSPNFAKSLQPSTNEVGKTESLLDRLIVGSLVATVEQ